MIFLKTIILIMISPIVFNGFFMFLGGGRASVKKLLYLKPNSILGKILHFYVNYSRLKHDILKDFLFQQREYNKPRVTSRAVEDYIDTGDDMSGYGRKEYDKGGEKLTDQQRGVILPLIQNELLDGAGTICEIGTGNGDVIAHLANLYPKCHCWGIDFSTKTAKEKHALKNVGFSSGYALDILQESKEDIEMLFASSTFVFFSPAELASYSELFCEKGIRKIILMEPHWFGYSQKLIRESDFSSVHLESGLWYHDYCAYFEKVGYKINLFEERPYTHPLSTRPDIVLSLVVASK